MTNPKGKGELSDDQAEKIAGGRLDQGDDIAPNQPPRDQYAKPGPGDPAPDVNMDRPRDGQASS